MCSLVVDGGILGRGRRAGAEPTWWARAKFHERVAFPPSITPARPLALHTGHSSRFCTTTRTSTTALLHDALDPSSPLAGSDRARLGYLRRGCVPLSFSEL